MEASRESAKVYSMGFVSAIRSRAVSCAVRRREPRGSHWMCGKAGATGDAGRAGGGGIVSYCNLFTDGALNV